MGSSDSQRLASLFELLSATDRASLLSFAEFLAQRSSLSLPSMPAPSQTEPEPVPEPNRIPRPDSEKVVAAVKRLSQSYFMLDKRKMLGVTSDLVTQHILHGREAAQVIDELEETFREQYRQLIEGDD
jgi:hypothetical protein